jgi:SAM-dependent methyltransferase
MAIAIDVPARTETIGRAYAPAKPFLGFRTDQCCAQAQAVDARLNKQNNLLQAQVVMALPVNDSDRELVHYGKDFWIEENLKYLPPHYRLKKAAQIANRIASGRESYLLDVGCGPATLMLHLRPNIHYYGIDIAIQHPAPNLIETNILDTPIKFEDKQFDIVIAQGLVEFLGDRQSQKFAEIAQVLTADGTFIVSYANFGHRDSGRYTQPNYRIKASDSFQPYSNIRTLDNFRRDLAAQFRIRRCFPTSHNWNFSEPQRKLNQAANMHVNLRVPFISAKLAVSYFFICSPRHPKRS